MNIIGFRDIVISIIIIIIIIFIAFDYSKKLKTKYLKNILYTALSFKVIFVLLGGVLLYFAKTGDTIAYFQDTEYLFNIVLCHPESVVTLLTEIYPDLSPELQSYFPDDYTFQTPGHNSGRVATFGLIPYIFFLKTYMGISFAFSMFAFVASWNLFIVLIKIYPFAVKQIAIVLLYIPSIVFWSGGYLKDPLSQGGVVLFIYTVIEFIYFKRKNIRLFILFVIALRIVLIIKSYIVLPFIPLCLYFFYTQMDTFSFKIPQMRIVIRCGIFFLAITGIFWLINDPSILGRFALDTILEEVQIQKEGYGLQEQGSYINLNQFDGTITGLISMIPVGIIAIYFRPFLWEGNSMLMLIASMENLIIYYYVFLLFRIYNFNIIKIIINITEDKLVLIFFIYSILLGVFIGISNPNFGTLSRYRISPLTFFLLVIVIQIMKIQTKQRQEIR